MKSSQLLCRPEVRGAGQRKTPRRYPPAAAASHFSIPAETSHPDCPDKAFPVHDRHFSLLRRIAGGRGEFSRTNGHPHRADGILTQGGEAFPAVLSCEPRVARVRLVVRMARVPNGDGALAAALLQHQADTAYARFILDTETDGTLMLEAATCCPPDSQLGVEIVKQVLRDVCRVLADSRLWAVLGLAKAKSCGQPIRNW